MMNETHKAKLLDAVNKAQGYTHGKYRGANGEANCVIAHLAAADGVLDQLVEGEGVLSKDATRPLLESLGYDIPLLVRLQDIWDSGSEARLRSWNGQVFVWTEAYYRGFLGVSEAVAREAMTKAVESCTFEPASKETLEIPPVASLYDFVNTYVQPDPKNKGSLTFTKVLEPSAASMPAQVEV